MGFAPFMVNLDEGNIPVTSGYTPFDVNSKRPYRGEKRSDLAYITLPDGRDEKGQPKFRAQCIGNADASTLLRDEWKSIDATIGQERQLRMAFVNWLISKGCVIDIPNGLGVTQYEWQNISAMSGADISMDGMKQADTNRPEYTSETIPLPITAANWRLNLRYLEESRRKGMPMDTFMMSEKARNVAQFVETMMVQGANSFKYAGDTLYGLLDSPNVEALTSGSGLFTQAWDDSTITGTGILKDLLAMVKKMNDNKRFGKFALWLPQKYETALAQDYVSGYPKTIGARLMETGMLEGIYYSDYINQDSNSKDRICLIEPSKATIAVVRGMDFRDFEWQAYGGWVMEHKIAGIYAPLIRKDAGGLYGIVKATLA